MSKMTAGQAAIENLTNPDYRPDDHKEYSKQLQLKIHATLLDAIDKGKAKYTDDFFIIVHTPVEAMLGAMPNIRVEVRTTCPKPTYNTIVYQFMRVRDDIELLWALPSRRDCKFYRHYKDQVLPEEQPRLKMILDFYNGTLDRLSDQRNGLRKDGIIVLAE